MNSSQLSLRLDWGSVPWEGQSPRALTRAAIALFSRREPQKDDRFFVDPDQLDFFRLVSEKAPREVSRGAPLLVEPRSLR